VANLHRLMFVVLVLFSSWLPSTSYASFPVSGGGTGTSYRGDGTMCAVDYASACALIGGVLGPAPNYYCSNNYSHYGCPLPTTCPANATKSGSTCTCQVGFTQIGSGASATCVNPNLEKCAGVEGGVDLFTGFSSLPTFGASFCPSDGAASSCASKVTGGYCVIKGGVKTCTHEVTYSGTTCTPPAPSPTESPVPTPCKGTYGQVNGVDVCLPLGTDPAATVETSKKTETTTTPGDGTGPTTTATEQKATCIGSMCTTEKTKTTTGPDGVPTTTTEKKTESKDDFCKDNPREPACLSSKFSGAACGAKPACDGDAIQCAVADFTFKTQCALTTAPDPEETPALKAYNTAASQSQGDQTTGEDVLSTVNLGPSAFDQANPLGAAAGLSDVIVTVWQTPVTLPFSLLNQWLERIGWLFQAVTFLLCARIVLRG
jgi:hypothetical protein